MLGGSMASLQLRCEEPTSEKNTSGQNSEGPMSHGYLQCPRSGQSCRGLSTTSESAPIAVESKAHWADAPPHERARGLWLSLNARAKAKDQAKGQGSRRPLAESLISPTSDVEGTLLEGTSALRDGRPGPLADATPRESARGPWLSRSTPRHRATAGALTNHPAPMPVADALPPENNPK